MAKEIIKNNAINITGTAGTTYDLADLATKNTRTSSDEELLVQIWYWSPLFDKSNPHSKPNPPQPKLGQIWLSQLIDAKKNPDLFEKLQTTEE